jgi:UDP-N-acetylmuramoyl-L-alanyl-D-glutamate--2,6-diaminopimelate ligase
MLDNILNTIKKFIPKKLFEALAPLYHYSLALIGAVLFGLPSRSLTVIAVTGTKGKSSTTEMLNSIFEKAGHKTLLLNTIRFKIGIESTPNRKKMTVPGRFFLQKMMRKALLENCDVAIIELSSEAAKQYRHKFVYLDALVFTNLAPEHIESHGSFDKYKKAKLSLTESLRLSNGKKSIMVANMDDLAGQDFLNSGARNPVPYSLKDAGIYKLEDDGVTFNFKGLEIKSKLLGRFNLENMLAAATLASTFDINTETIKKGLENLSVIKGRVEFVRVSDKQKFDVVVDYAHTAESLRELYSAFEGKRKICVLGNTGGGRDKWKRPEMAKVADQLCDEVYLTNEDPYDEDPKQIISDMLPGFKKNTPKIIMDRRECINTAMKFAKDNDVVLITGKGTDPYIMLEDNKKLPWSDYEVAKEELLKILK